MNYALYIVVSAHGGDGISTNVLKFHSKAAMIAAKEALNKELNTWGTGVVARFTMLEEVAD